MQNTHTHKHRTVVNKQIKRNEKQPGEKEKRRTIEIEKLCKIIAHNYKQQTTNIICLYSSATVSHCIFDNMRI